MVPDYVLGTKKCFQGTLIVMHVVNVEPEKEKQCKMIRDLFNESGMMTYMQVAE